MDTPPSDRNVVAAHLARKVEMVLNMTSDPRFNSLRFRIERDIDEWQRTFEISGKVLLPDGKTQIELEEYLRMTRPAFILAFDKKTGGLTTLEVSSSATEIHKPDFPAPVIEPCARDEAKAKQPAKRRRVKTAAPPQNAL
jgi:hypothetical protein